MAHNRLRDIRANHVLWNRGMLSAPEPRGLQRCMTHCASARTFLGPVCSCVLRGWVCFAVWLYMSDLRDSV